MAVTHSHWRSDDPGVLEAQEAMEAAMVAETERLLDLEEGLTPAEDAVLVYDHAGPGRLHMVALGFIPKLLEDVDDVPEGWVVERRVSGMLKEWWVPDPSTEPGRILALSNADSRNIDLAMSYPGMPRLHLTSTMSLLAGEFFGNGTYTYVRWTEPLPQGEIDGDMWQECLASEFWAAWETLKEGLEVE